MDMHMISFNEEDVETLVKLGLKSSEAKIYLALISVKSAEAKKIAQITGIDRGEVYRQLVNLQEKGLIQKILHQRANGYKPMPLNELVGILIAQKSKENQEVFRKAETLLKKGTCHVNSLQEEALNISIVPKNEHFRKRISLKKFSSSQKEVLWYTQIDRVPKALSRYYAAMKKPAFRARIRAIAELNSPPDDTIRIIDKFKEENPFFEIRYTEPSYLINFEIFDNEEMNFAIEEMKDPNSQIVNTNSKHLIKVIKEFFEFKWNTGVTTYSKMK